MFPLPNITIEYRETVFEMRIYCVRSAGKRLLALVLVFSFPATQIADTDPQFDRNLRHTTLTAQYQFNGFPFEFGRMVDALLFLVFHKNLP